MTETPLSVFTPHCPLPTAHSPRQQRLTFEIDPPRLVPPPRTTTMNLRTLPLPTDMLTTVVTVVDSVMADTSVSAGIGAV